MTRIRRVLAVALTAVAIFACTHAAHACACCTNSAWRYVEVENLGGPKLSEIERMQFAKTAKLMLGEANEDGIKGVEDPQEDYKLAVTRTKDRIAFTFADEKNRKGTLTLAMPKTVSIFEVDPRGRSDTEEKAVDGSLGPALYKEWKLNTNAAGDGLFRVLTRAGQKMTLIFHGRGIGCTDASHFTDWTLLVYGNAGKITLYGRLTSAGQ